MISRKWFFGALGRLWLPAFAMFASFVVFQTIGGDQLSSGLGVAIAKSLKIVANVAIWLAGAWLFNRLLEMMFWQGVVGHALGRNPPRLVIQLTGVLVFLLALSGIVRFVFGESVTAIWAASGAIGIVVGFALRNLILDTFSGLAIHLERPFKVGDWITCHARMGDYIGRIEETNWRTTRLWTTSRNIIIIPNSYLTTTLITNFSMPETPARFEMTFVLDFSVPSERAIRILSAAVVSAIGRKGPLADPPPKVRVDEVSKYGVEYKMRYFLEPADVSPSKARDTITRAVLEHINQAGIALSYPRQDVFYARMPWRHKDWSYLKDQIHQLQSLSLFTHLGSGLIKPTRSQWPRLLWLP
jgi:small-conductance mechanosensitive channel